jgi:hypothetical protein
MSCLADLLADLSLAAQLRGFSAQLRGFNIWLRYDPAGLYFSSMAKEALTTESNSEADHRES